MRPGLPALLFLLAGALFSVVALAGGESEGPLHVVGAGLFTVGLVLLIVLGRRKQPAPPP